MTLVDSTYKFVYFDCNPLLSKEGVFNNCDLSAAINTFNFPSAEPLPGRENPVPYVIVSNDAFSLKPYLLKPYQEFSVPNSVFNTRLKKARKVSENVFGIIANRFRILREPMKLGPEKTASIVSAICVLHNFLMSRESQFYAPEGTFDTDEQDGEWRILGMPDSNLLELDQETAPNIDSNAKYIRDEFRDYFVSGRNSQPI